MVVLSYEELYVLVVLVVSTVLLLTRIVRFDIVGLMTMILLVVGGVVPITKSLEYFGSTVIVVLASVMILSHTLEESGFLDKFAELIARAIKNEYLILALMFLFVSIVSGFMSDVALVAIFIPFMYALSRTFKKKLSKYLIPLSYSAIVGGRYTIFGTSTNLIIDQLWFDKYNHYLSISQFTYIGLLIIIISIPILLLISIIMPSRESVVLSIDDVKSGEYLIEVNVGKDSEWVGLRRDEIERKYGIKIKSILPRRLGRTNIIRENMTLIVQIEKEALTTISSIKGLSIKSGKDIPENAELVEAMITSDSTLVGYSIEDLNIEDKYGISIIGISSSGRKILGRITHVTLRPGDSLLIMGDEGSIARFLDDYGLVPIRGKGVRLFSIRKGLGAIIALVIATGASFMGVNIALAFLIPTIALVLSNLVNYKRIYQYLDLPVLVFIASYLSLGYAMESSGLSELIIQVMPKSLLLLFIVTALLANFINNVTAAVIMGPVALLFPNPLVAITVVAMASTTTFLTPYSHPANLLIMNPGNYNIRDYLVAGVVMFILVLLATLYYTHSI